MAASNLSEILRIDLCKCPSELLETIAKNCCRLKNIDAQTIRFILLHISCSFVLKNGIKSMNIGYVISCLY